MRRIIRAAVPGILIVAACSIVVFCAGCLLRTPYLLDVANEPAKPQVTPTPRVTAERIERIVRAHLVDGYVDPAKVGTWLDALGAKPEPIIQLLQGLAVNTSGDPGSLYEAFTNDVSPALAVIGGVLREDPAPSVWGIPPPPLAIEDNFVGLGPLARPLDNLIVTGLELDAERFVANARAIAPSLLVLQNLAGTESLSDTDLRAGIQSGAQAARTYLLARKWQRRVGHPTTALVMSGGAANGAFTAGFVWRLTEVLQACRAASGTLGCPGAGLDLTVGSSTGSLVGVTADIFSSPGREQAARDFLLRNYTCPVAADFYCMNDVWIWGLFGKTRGLVQFDGVRRKLDEILSDAERDNNMELVTMTVDYQTGDLLAESDQDPADGRTKKDRLDAVLASIVEPVMADPVDRLGRPNGDRSGTFIDGGVRSGTPVMEASRRGAERVLVIKSSGLDSDLKPPQQNAASMLLRTIDLLVDQVGTAEIQEATLHAIARRLGEYNVCDTRLGIVGDRAVGKADKDDEVMTDERVSAKTEFCQRKTLAPGAEPGTAHIESAVATFLGPEVFGQVAQSWRSVWVVKPEGNESLSGYKVDPKVMRGLFELGVNTFQKRCEEVLRLLEVPRGVWKAECKPEAGAAAVARAKADMEKCVPKPSSLKPCKN